MKLGLIITSLHVVIGFQVPHRFGPRLCSSTKIHSKPGSWSVTDDWEALSEQENAGPDVFDMLDRDLAADAAKLMERGLTGYTYPEEDVRLRAKIASIYERTNPEMYDTALDSDENKVSFEDKMGREISMLVRCGEIPEEMLVREGRIQEPLSDQELNDVSQLIETTSNPDVPEPSEFLLEATSTMFKEHATSRNGTLVMGADGLSKWLQQCLGTEEPHPISKYDKRVVSLISKYGTYGTGYLTEKNFLDLYMDAIGKVVSGGNQKTERLYKLNQSTIKNLFRDIRNHGIQTPVEQEWERQAEEFRKSGAGAATKQEIQAMKDNQNFLDECELIDLPNSSTRPSHEKLVFADDDKTTPLWVNDGEHVYISEEACIGCMHCVQACPESFTMAWNGKARTYEQRISPEVDVAISTCPVDCMHKVSFQELKELETARDQGLDKVLNIQTKGDKAKRDKKWDMYHYLKTKCYMSNKCPQNGCYQCFKYANPGDNPHFKEKKKKADKVRAQAFIKRGIADRFRKYADL